MIVLWLRKMQADKNVVAGVSFISVLTNILIIIIILIIIGANMACQ